MSKQVSGNIRKFSNVCAILEKYNHNRAKLIPILSEVQEEYRYLPEEVMNFIATSLNVPPASVYGVATFYSHFAFEAKGKHIVKICNGTACYVKKSQSILEAMRKHLGLTDKQITTDDHMFTVETVSCLGACGLSPVIVVDDEVHGLVTPEKAVNILKNIQEKEAGANE